MMDADRSLPNEHARVDELEGNDHERLAGRCPLCGGEKQPGTTTFAVDLKFGVVVVREVPALVCTQCGDAWIDDPVAAKLKSVVAEARRKQALVEVTLCQQVACSIRTAR
jgi:YgiT-type zinc finger domain-containing protein